MCLYVRFLCDLKSQFRSFKQFAATDLAHKIVHDHSQFTHDLCDFFFTIPTFLGGS